MTDMQLPAEPISVLGGIKKLRGPQARVEAARQAADSREKKPTKASVTTATLNEQPVLKPEIKIATPVVDAIIANQPTEDAEISFTPSQLKGIEAIVAGIIKSQEATTSKLVEAIIESKKPYVNPAEALNKKAAAQQNREVQERLHAAMKNARAHCAHLQGSHELSSFSSPYGLTSIIKHALDTGEFIGMCTNCGRIWRDTDPDYMTWMTRKSGNLPSRSGQRTFLDPRRAIESGKLVQ